MSNQGPAGPSPGDRLARLLRAIRLIADEPALIRAPATREGTMKKAQMILSFAIALALWGAVTYYATANIGDTVLSPLYYRIPIWIIIGVAFFTHLFYAAELSGKFRKRE